jgi:hypothetical protein
VTSRQLHKVELIDDIQIATKKDMFDVDESKQITNRSSDENVGKTIAVRNNGSTNSSESPVMALNKDKATNLEVNVNQIAISSDESLQFSSVIEFDNSEFESLDEDKSDFWNKAFGTESKLKATNQLDTSLKRSDSLKQIQRSNMTNVSKETESVPRYDILLQKGSRILDFLFKPTEINENINHCKSSTISSVVEFDGNEQNKEKESDWWTKAFHR